MLAAVGGNRRDDDPTKTKNRRDAGPTKSTALLRERKGYIERVLSVAFSLDERRGLSASFDETMRLWDVASGREISSFPHPHNPLWTAAISPDGTLAVSADDDRILRLWRLSK